VQQFSGFVGSQLAIPKDLMKQAGAMVSPECAGTTCSMMRPTRANKPNGYFLGSYSIATAPEPNSSRLTSRKSITFDSPANNVGPWPASRNDACLRPRYCTMIAAPVQCDVDGIPKGLHYARVLPMGQTSRSAASGPEPLT
jgi:hypothetical protein